MWREKMSENLDPATELESLYQLQQEAEGVTLAGPQRLEIRAEIELASVLLGHIVQYRDAR
jgi:hypothetical protein